MWATFRRNREETGRAIRKRQGGNGEPPGKRRFLCHEETRKPSRKPRQKKAFQILFPPDTKLKHTVAAQSLGGERPLAQECGCISPVIS